MFYTFIDEKTEDCTNTRRFITACVGFRREAWISASDKAVEIGSISRKKRFEKLLRMLEDHDGFADITFADLPPELVPTGENDGTLDVPQMARTDHVWSLCFLFSVVPVLAMFHEAGGVARNIEVYYDEKNLKIKHRIAIEKIFKEQFARLATEHACKRGFNQGHAVEVSKVVQVKGCSNLNGADAFQLGTTLPHHLCAQSDRLLRSSGYSRLRIVNVTESVKSVLDHFA